jgi:hypothetical protein
MRTFLVLVMGFLQLLCSWDVAAAAKFPGGEGNVPTGLPKSLDNQTVLLSRQIRHSYKDFFLLRGLRTSPVSAAALWPAAELRCGVLLGSAGFGEAFFGVDFLGVAFLGVALGLSALAGGAGASAGRSAALLGALAS